MPNKIVYKIQTVLRVSLVQKCDFLPILPWKMPKNGKKSDKSLTFFINLNLGMIMHCILCKKIEEAIICSSIEVSYLSTLIHGIPNFFWATKI